MIEFILAVLILAALLALFIRCTLLSKLQVRRMRWRARLRMKPGPGFASHMEILVRWSRWAAVYHGKRGRPDLGCWRRLVSRSTDYAVRLGRANLFRRVFARSEDQIGIIAPPRTGKTGVLADRIYSHPGAVVNVTTRADVYRLTAGKRAEMGPVEVFNPEGIGGIESTFRPDIISGCIDPATALRISSALIGPMDGAGDMQFWLEKAKTALAALLHAAALLHLDFTVVAHWANRIDEEGPGRAVTIPGASRELLGQPPNCAAKVNRPTASG